MKPVASFPRARARYVIVNAGPTPVPYVIQAASQRSHLAVDTSLPALDDIELERVRILPRLSFTVAARSVVVLVEARGALAQRLLLEAANV